MTFTFYRNAKFPQKAHGCVLLRPFVNSERLDGGLDSRSPILGASPRNQSLVRRKPRYRHVESIGWMKKRHELLSLGLPRHGPHAFLRRRG